MKRMMLSETLLSLRAAACAIYDRGLMSGKNQEELAKEIEPLTKALHHTISKAAEDDLPGCVIAVQRLQNMAKAHREDAQYLLEKADDDQNHARYIQKALIKRMKKVGVEEMKNGDFTATIVKSPSGDGIILR